MNQLETLDTKALANRWNLKPSTLDNWRNIGKGPKFLKIGGRILYPAEFVLAYEQAAQRTSTSDEGDAA